MLLHLKAKKQTYIGAVADRGKCIWRRQRARWAVCRRGGASAGVAAEVALCIRIGGYTALDNGQSDWDFPKTFYVCTYGLGTAGSVGVGDRIRGIRAAVLAADTI